MSSKPKVAVIGSNSFSGSDFVDLLLEDGRYSVFGISRSAEPAALFLPYKRHPKPDFRFFQMDLNRDMPGVISLLDSLSPDYIVNFAALSEVAPSWLNPAQWFMTNAVSVTELAHGLKDRNYLKKYVHISTPEVYGTCVGTVTESAHLNPSSPYAASKAAGDLSLCTFYKNFAFPVVMIRATNVYGAHQQLHKIIPRTIIYLKSGRIIELHGGGRAVKSYIHIRDVSRGELAAMEAGEPGRTYHFSPGEQGINIRDLVGMICGLMGVDFSKATKDVAERLGQDAAYVIDSTRARRELGWKPVVILEEGVSEVIEWIEREFVDIVKQPLDYVHKP